MRSLLVLVAIVACAAYTMRPPVVSARVSIEKLRLSTNDRDAYTSAYCLVTNTAHNSLWYQCAAKHNPVYECQTRSAGKWSQHGYYWCGTCMSEIGELNPGESIAFEAVCFNTPDGLKFGLPLSTSKSMDKLTTVWSPPKEWQPSNPNAMAMASP